MLRHRVKSEDLASRSGLSARHRDGALLALAIAFAAVAAIVATMPSPSANLF